MTIAACSLALAISFSGCAGRSEDARVTVRDSAGVTIVESREATWAPGEEWTLSPKPLAVIGTADGPEEYSLYNVRVALLLPDRRILVANAGTDELRYYDSAGTYLYAVGRDGYGPGEFKSISWVWRARDSLVVFDFGRDRVFVFSDSGAYGRTVMLDREPRGRPGAVGVFADGSMLGLQFLFSGGSGFRRERSEGVYRHYSPDGEVLDSLGVFFLEDQYREDWSGDQPGMFFAVGGAAPFGRRASTLVFGQRVYYASSETYDIQIFDAAGRLLRIIRRPIANQPVTGSDIDAFKEYFVEGTEPNSWSRRRVNDLEFPDTKPAYGTVKMDRLGDLWVSEYSFDQRDRVGRWTVFDPDGRMLGVVHVPTGALIKDIGDDYLIGTWRTDQDVEQVRMYRLVKQ